MIMTITVCVRHTAMESAFKQSINLSNIKWELVNKLCSRKKS